jgi:hypothetical protein
MLPEKSAPGGSCRKKIPPVSYRRDRGNWLVLELTARAIVSGTEAVATTNDLLPALSADLHRSDVAPPGQPSPYGMNACNEPD